MILSANQIILIISVILVFTKLFKLKSHIQGPLYQSIISALEWIGLIIGLLMFFKNLDEVIDTLNYAADTLWPELQTLAKNLLLKLKIFLHRLTEL